MISTQVALALVCVAPVALLPTRPAEPLILFHKKPEDRAGARGVFINWPRHQPAGARQPRPRPDERVDGPVKRLLRRVLALKFAFLRRR